MLILADLARLSSILSSSCL